MSLDRTNWIDERFFIPAGTLIAPLLFNHRVGVLMSHKATQLHGFTDADLEFLKGIGVKAP